MSAKKHGQYSIGLYVYIHFSQSYGSITHLQLHYSTVGDISRCCVIFLFVVISTKIHVSPQKSAVRHESFEPAYDLW